MRFQRKSGDAPQAQRNPRIVPIAGLGLARAASAKKAKNPKSKNRQRTNQKKKTKQANPQKAKKTQRKKTADGRARAAKAVRTAKSKSPCIPKCQWKCLSTLT